MLHDNMNISFLMVYAQQVEEERAKRKSRYAKKARSFEGGSSKGRIEFQDKPRFKKWASNKVPSKFLKVRDDRVKPKKRRDTSSPNKKPTCAKCEKVHLG